VGGGAEHCCRCCPSKKTHSAVPGSTYTAYPDEVQLTGEQFPRSGKKAQCQEADVADTPAVVLGVLHCCQKCLWNGYKM